VAYAQEKGVIISINPDAHAISGIADLKYRVLAARKGGLLKRHTLNALPLSDFEKWLTDRK
jgi:DNA polymerase (family 10)